jgi:hypothetical protein
MAARSAAYWSPIHSAARWRANITMKKILGALLVASLFHAAPAMAAQSALLSYAGCPLGGNLRAVSINPRTAGAPPERSADSDSAKQAVSVADGVRVMLAFPESDPFVNLKIERSVPGHYAADKQIILDQLESMARRKRGAAGKVERSMDRGIDIAALNNSTLEGGIVSMVTLFDERQEIIATAYLLNNRRRAFQTFEEYQGLRDRFIGDLTSCMALLSRRQ